MRVEFASSVLWTPFESDQWGQTVSCKPWRKSIIPGTLIQSRIFSNCAFYKDVFKEWIRVSQGATHCGNESKWCETSLHCDCLSIKCSLLHIVTKNTKWSRGETEAQRWYALICCVVRSITSLSINQLKEMHWQCSCSHKTHTEFFMKKSGLHYKVL